jgi:hypothetical protein
MNNQLSPRSFLFLFCVTGLALGIGGCAKNKGVISTQSENSACEGLQNVIAQSSSDFSSLKVGAGVADYDHTRWDTKPIFQDADCDVIRWGNGKVNFACTWSSKSQEEAKKDFSYGLDVAKTCLGSSWTQSAIPGVTGEGVRFSAPGNASVVDVRVAKELAPSQSWHTSLTVGAPINRDAK